MFLILFFCLFVRLFFKYNMLLERSCNIQNKLLYLIFNTFDHFIFYSYYRGWYKFPERCKRTPSITVGRDGRDERKYRWRLAYFWSSCCDRSSSGWNIQVRINEKWKSGSEIWENKPVTTDWSLILALLNANLWKNFFVVTLNIQTVSKYISAHLFRGST